ncbi:olfactory receptor 12D1-like [Pelobates fuscus]|uniref:olfactory receptor 12D1-like n=1 Tax=Pelobates fuscus TaxID=191477 RepID=UPI002FE43035
MEIANVTSVNQFILMGLTNLPWLQKVLFVSFLFFYEINILGNLIIMFLAMRDPSLQAPMYFLLANLSFLDIWFSSVTVPKMLVGFLFDNTISVWGCIAQMHFFHFLGCAEGVLLAAMGYDRYVAICSPLRYNTIMNKTFCTQLVFTSWFIGFFSALIHSVMTSMLPFCNFNKVRHFFCNVKPVIKLACSSTFINEITVATLSGFLSTCTFSLTFLSYLFIIIHLSKIHSSQRSLKAFSTCSSHLTVVSLFYGTAMCTYLGPSSDVSIEKDKVAAVLFTVITPTLNPIIYTLRNKEVRKSLKKMFQSLQ